MDWFEAAYGWDARWRTAIGKYNGGPYASENNGFFGGNDCDTMCCTGWKKYSQMQHFENDIEGVEAKITTRYGKLCGEAANVDDVFTQTFVYCGISKEVGNQVKWAQTGYSFWREDGDMDVIRSVYVEVQGDKSYPYQWFRYVVPNPNGPDQPPSDGDTIRYSCDLNTVESKWYFFINGTAVNYDPWPPPPSDPNSWSSGGTNIVIAGEIGHNEGDMPGTYSAPCRFEDIIYRLGGSSLYIQAHCDPKDYLNTDDNTQWGIEWDTSLNLIREVRLWDNFPQP